MNEGTEEKGINIHILQRNNGAQRLQCPTHPCAHSWEVGEDPQGSAGLSLVALYACQ